MILASKPTYKVRASRRYVLAMWSKDEIKIV